MATGRVPTTANSPLTTKGDLFGYSTAPARLPVGSDGETIVADSSTSTGLRYTGNFAAGKNKIINGDFGIWQRGTSFTNPNAVYTADRWYYIDDLGTGLTVSRQSFSPGTAPVAGYEGTYFLRYSRTSGTTTYNQIYQPIEDVRTFAGQSITYSFWAKADAATTVTPLGYQVFGSGGSTAVDVVFTGTASLTTAWQRFSFTASVPSISGKTIGTNSNLRIVISMGTGNKVVDVWGVQVEYGSVATAFQTMTGTIQGELAACQRYYWQQATGTNQNLTLAAYQSTTLPIGLVQYPVTMRVTPTLSYVSGTNYYAIDITNSILTFNDVANSLASNVASRLYATTGSSTAGYSGIIRTNNAAAAVGWSAEL